MRRSRQSAFANPVLVGAATLLALMVALFLAYSANQGLPFVPTKELKVEIGDGANLVIGNDVRQGGFRIGLVSDMRPVELASGQVGAELTLRLDKANGNVPADSTVTILPRSVLGLKYVDLEKGTSTKLIPDGGSLPISHTSVPVQFDDIFKTFDTKTRTAVQQNLVGFGDTLAGRGAALNDTIHSLPELLTHLQSVAHSLSAPSTGLTRLLVSLNSFMGTVAPVAQTNARLFTDLATTFEAISRDTNALESTIAESPSTLAVSTDSLKTQKPFLADLTTLGRGLAPATSELVGALPHINPAIEAGTRTLVRTPSLNANLQQVLNALKQLALAPGTNIAINALGATAQTLNPMIRYLGPFQTVCNDWNYWWTYLAEHFTAHTSYGYAQRSLINTAIGGVGSLGAAVPASNAGTDPLVLPSLGGGVQNLHGQAYGAAIDNLGNADCETGQRGYAKKLNYFDPKGRNLATDQHNPANQGPTFRGRAHVPAGETFSRNPQTGPQTAHNLLNP